MKKSREIKQTAETIWVPIGFVSRNLDRFKKIEDSYNHSLFTRLEENASGDVFSSWESEKATLALVLSGDVATARRIAEDADNHGFYLTTGHLSANALHQAKYSIISFIALCCRAVVNYGCSESQAYIMSDAYIQQIDLLDTVPDVYAMMFGAIVAYTALVDSYNMEGLSIPIQKCISYIEAHLHLPITLTELASCCGLSPNYLSDLFEKELGQRPIAYIRNKKLHRAADRLLSTDVTSGELALYYAFPSASAFSCAFKKEFGLTPTEYRKQKRNSLF